MAVTRSTLPPPVRDLPDLDPDSPTAPDWQLADILRAAITDGIYPVGSTMPRLYRLMARYGLPERDALRAYRALQQQGLITGNVRDGAEVIAAPSTSDIAKTAES